MTDPEIEEVSHMLRQQHREPGQLIDHLDGERVFLLKAGQVRLYRTSPEGQETTTSVLRPGQLFNLGGMSGESGTTMAEAITPSVVCDASASHFMGVLARHPVLMARVTMMMARQIFKLEETIERMSQHSGKGRVAAVLLDMVDNADGAAEAGLVPLNQVQIGKMAGLTREAAARAIALLREDGIVSRQGPILVLDVERLRAAARD
ncbi:MAG: Crp/Fnr family transcriptional regulator [Candidatus Dormibacteria bacterium]